MTRLTWRSSLASQEVLNYGPLALWLPLLDQLDIEGIIDRHLPCAPQQEHSHGEVLRLLLLARLAQPTALINVAEWAEQSGAAILSNIPVDKLNDDRLGRALDAFFEQRHSILGTVTAQALQLTGLTLQRLHFDPTHLTFSGAYESSRERPQAAEPMRGDADLLPAHICHGYNANDKMIQAAQLGIVDERGVVPVFAHCLDGNRNGHPAIQQTFELVNQYLNLPPQVLLISDRGTCSLEHIARLYRHGHRVVCPGQWQDYRASYDAVADQLHWQEASFLSIEQRRRRERNSTLPREHYEIAVRKHTFADPLDGSEIPARLLFIHSTADGRAVRERRRNNVAKIQAGLQKIQAKLERGHPQCTATSVQKEIARLLGKRDAARYFTWQLIELTPAEQAALPAPAKKGHVRQRLRLEYTYDAALAEADQPHDGLSVLVTTADLTCSGDQLFTYYKQQNFIESAHHQWKTPLEVSPVFLKSPRRVEALVCLLQLALQAYHVLERLYRQNVPDDAPRAQHHMTSEQLLRNFRVYGLLVQSSVCGQVIHPTRLNNQQRQILDRLHFSTPAQTLEQRLHPEPSG